VCVDADVGNMDATTAAFAGATHIAKLQTSCSVSPACRSKRRRDRIYDPDTKRYTLHPAAAASYARSTSWRACWACRPPRWPVECGDVGGNFGTRNAFYPEFALVAWAARRVGRPVKWTCERSEAFACDYQGRDQVIQAELALDASGRFLALRAR